jgi:hypothetical protein
MLAVESVKRRKPLTGTPSPRIAPPTPVKADIVEFEKRATTIGLKLYPWQIRAARYLTAKNAKGHPLYREICIVVARQNGKTSLLLPLVVSRLIAGDRITHAAQHLRLPGELHRQLAEIFQTHYPELIPGKRGISWRAGQEAIRLTTGGVYEIVAASGGAPRGPTNKLVIIDELREMTDDRFIAGIKPTMVAQTDAQIVYLSNAGTSHSEVLNSLRARAGEDPRLAYLEWSAPPELREDDIAGWVQANPAIGHNPGLLANLEDEYRAALLGGTMASFETEHLCRWVAAMDERLVKPHDWEAQEFGDVGPPTRPVMAINMDPSGDRASAVIAWADEEKIVLDVHDTIGAPIDASLLGPDLLKLATANRVSVIAFDPYTDADLVRYLPKSKPKSINGRDYASASEKFVRLVAERRLRVHDPKGVLSKDLEWTTRKSGPYGSYMAVKASDEHTNTAAIAAVRAAWLASAPVNTNPARIY